MVIQGPGDNIKLLWSVMELLERIEQTGDFSLSIERYILAKQAGFRLRNDNGWVLGQDQETTGRHKATNGGRPDEKGNPEESQEREISQKTTAFSCGNY